jgi:hypothetical protein
MLGACSIVYLATGLQHAGDYRGVRQQMSMLDRAPD